MAKYWLKSSPDAPADGPVSAAEVKRRAAAGEIARTTLISMDAVTWHPAGRVKGIFTGPATMARAAETTTTAAMSEGGNGVSPAPPRPPHSRVPPVYPGTERRHVASAAVAEPRVAPPPSPMSSPTPPAAEAGTGEIDAQPPMPMPPLPQAVAPPPPPALSYATPRGMGGAMAPPLRPRKSGAFLVIAILMIPVGLLHAYEWYVSFAERGSGVHDFVRFLACAAWVALVIPVFVMWIKWVAGAHRDAGVVSGFRHPTGPGTATGLMFVPLFNAIWAILMPGKLAGTVNDALEAAGLPKVSAGVVTACQLASVVAPLLGLYAITPLMYAISMRTIQDGFNRLAANRFAA